ATDAAGSPHPAKTAGQIHQVCRVAGAAQATSATATATPEPQSSPGLNMLEKPPSGWYNPPFPEARVFKHIPAALRSGLDSRHRQRHRETSGNSSFPMTGLVQI